jgi:hypothetical protein
VSSTATIKAIAYATGMTDSTVASATYTITPPSVASPAFSPATGAYSAAQTVAISTTTSGASIHYTTDGSTPSETAGILYSGPITVSSPTTINAIAYASGMTDSTVATATYTIAGWYNTSWNDRKLITINHTKVSGSSNLTNFPVLVSLTDADLATVANGGGVGLPDGRDILFTSADGATKLNHEIESYNPSTGQLIAWVQVPMVSPTTDTTMYIYYGNTSATSQQNPTGVWDSNYVGVWHFGNGTTLSASDSTSNGNNGTINGATATSGVIDGGANFNGSGSISEGATTNTNAPLLSVSIWMKSAQAQQPSYTTMFDRRGGAAFNNWILDTTYYGNTYEFCMTDDQGSGPSTGQYCLTSGTLDTNWHYLAGTYDGTTQTLYLDGTPVASNPVSITLGTGSYPLNWGSSNGSGQIFNGLLDEARFSRVARSAGWIATEYTNQSSPSTFFSVGSQQGSGAPPQVAMPTFSPAAGTYSSAQTVTISTPTSGASINYTTDGSTPSGTAGTPYSGPITVGATTTINAVAYENGFRDSAVATASYAINYVAAAPTFTPAEGTYSSTQTVSISTATSGASINYTTDGSTPSETAGVLYSGPITVSSTTTIKAIAYASGMADSAVISATFTFTNGSWSNPLSTGDRRSLIIATSSGFIQGDINNSINGNLSQHNWYFNNTNLSSNVWIQWDFGDPVIVDEAMFYQQDSSAQGTWIWQGSNDAASWTNVGSSFALGGTPTEDLTSLNGNATSYRFYRIAGVSGSTNSGPWTYQFEFHVNVATSNRNYANPLGSGDRRRLVVATASPGLIYSDIENSINGSLDQNVWSFYTTSLSSGAWMQWDFGNPIVIDEARLYQQYAVFQGAWQWQGSNTGATWTNIGTPFTLGGSTVNAVPIGNNVSAYRYYRLLGVSGTTNDGPWIRQFEFHAGLDTALLSYSNVQGSGNRIPSVIATASAGLIHGDVTHSVDGNIDQNDWYFNATSLSSSVWLQWDFGSAVVVDEARFYQQDSTPQGTWKWQGSNDASTWVDVGSSFALGGAPIQTIAALNGNVIAYRYYRILGVSGSASDNPWLREFEFHCGTINTTQVATPTFDPAAGTYAVGQTVSISTTTAVASIRYTTDGSTPSETAGTLYTGPIPVSSTTTINAIAYSGGMLDSVVASASYTITNPGVAEPTFSPAAGTYNAAQTVTISTATSGASIRYTTDGSTPSETTGTLYTGPITVSGTTTINAIAYASGMTDSVANSAAYTIAGSGWYNTSWATRKPVQIDHTKVWGSSNLTNFPVLVSLTDANLATTANGGGVGLSDGTDILFTAADGTTKLSHELEAYDPATGQLIAWVNVPALSPTSDTVIYVYYGNGAASDQQNKTAVWDSNYVGVWHLPNGSTLSANDSTTNADNGTIIGATATTGQIGGAMAANGSSQYVSLGTPSALQDLVRGNATFEAWVNTSSGGTLFARDDNNGSEGWAIGINGGLKVAVENVFSAGNQRFASTGAIGNNTWAHVVVTTLGGTTGPHTQTIFINGVEDSTGPGGSGSSDSDAAQTAYLLNATFNDLSSGTFNGSVDEIRISNTVRSANWIATEFNNGSSPSTFLSVGAAQGHP